MRTSITKFPAFRALGAMTVLSALAACGNARATDAALKDDLKSDLELASTTMNLATTRVDPSFLDSLETRPQGAPKAAAVVKKAPGPKAVRSRTPTVVAAVDDQVAATEDAGVTQTIAEAPAPDVSEPVAVAPRPAPMGTQPAGDYGTGGGVILGGGGIGGVILRGGGVDGDNCDLHTRGGRRGTSRGPVYVPTIPVTPSHPVPRSRPATRRGL